MFCVIQELTTKRENPLGFPKRLEVMQESVPADDGTERIKWGYTYSDECFERPVKKSYKVSVHQSYRDKDGKPRKKEFVLFTVKYYDLATGEFDTYNWVRRRLRKWLLHWEYQKKKFIKLLKVRSDHWNLNYKKNFSRQKIWSDLPVHSYLHHPCKPVLRIYE